MQVKRSGRTPAPWLFAIAALPYGAFNGVIALALPYLLRSDRVTLPQIASALAVIQSPAIWYFLWAPIVDLRFRKRTWVLLLAVASAICATAALHFGVATGLSAITTLFVIGSILNQPISSALGGLVSTVMPEKLQSRTAGWGQAGNLGGGALAGGLALWVSVRWPGAAMAAVVGALVALPALIVLAIDEPRRAPASVATRMAGVRTELAEMVRRREVWFAFLLFVSPAGSGALTALFPAAAVEYGASAGAVIWAVGVGGAALMAGGALAGGFVCERYDRWLIYPAVGVMAALSAGVMALMPLTPTTFILGSLSYALVTGFSYSAFMAIALELLGSESAGPGTQFTLCIAATNAPMVYMLWIDGAAHARFGVHGMLIADAVANGVAGILLVVAAWRYRARGRLGTSVAHVEHRTHPET